MQGIIFAAPGFWILEYQLVYKLLAASTHHIMGKFGGQNWIGEGFG